MLRSLQTLKSSTSTWSCLLVPAVAMTKGMSQTHTHISALLRLSLPYCLTAWVTVHRPPMLIQFRPKASQNPVDPRTSSGVFANKRIIHFSAVWSIIIIKQTTDLCRLLLYLAVCVSFVSPYLFINPPQFCPFGLRMRGGPPLRDYGIKVSVLTRNDAFKSRALPHRIGVCSLSVIRVPCRQVVLNRCMHSTGSGITWKSTQRLPSQSKRCMMNTSECAVSEGRRGGGGEPGRRWNVAS